MLFNSVNRKLSNNSHKTIMVESFNLNNLDNSMSRPIIQVKRASIQHNNLKYWLNRYLEYTTIHGLIWYCHTDNKILKIFSLIFGMVIILGLLGFLTYMSIDFNKSIDTELERIEWKKAEKIRYPNFTVCYSKFFDSRLMKEHNISDLMANYMTMALDTSVNEYAHHMVIDYKDYYTVLGRLKIELDEIFGSIQSLIFTRSILPYCNKVHIILYVITKLLIIPHILITGARNLLLIAKSMIISFIPKHSIMEKN